MKNMKYKIILWGIGYVYNRTQSLIKYFELLNQIEIVGITAQKVPCAKMLDGYRIFEIKEIQKVEYDYIIVLSDNYYEEIVKTAVNEFGIERKKVINYKILHIPNINMNQYFKLYESELTILSNNCWGGIAYNTLGMECLSPFKNLFINDYDYLIILSNLKYYIGINPQFSRNETDIHTGIEYPVLKIENIEIHCNHYTDSCKAIDDWIRRAKKINYDNILCEMYTENRNIAEKFNNLKQYNNKICFVPWQSKNKNDIYLKLGYNQTEFYQAVNSTALLDNNGIQYSLLDFLSGTSKVRLK